MASPQKENGYTAIANELMEALARIRIPGEAMQVFLYILRKTYGYNKPEDAVSLSQFVLGTGLKKNSVCRGIAKLKALNIIHQKGYSVAHIYRVNKDFTTWTPFTKKSTDSPKSERGVLQKVNKQSPKKSTTKVDKVDITKDNSANKSHRDDFLEKWSFPKANYTQVTDAYKQIKQVSPVKNEWLPILKEIKLIFKSGRTPEQIIQAMEICNSNYDDWSMSTVRMKIADVVAGKLQAKKKLGEKEKLIITGVRDI